MALQKITQEIIDSLRKDYHDGMSKRELGRKYNVNHNTMIRWIENM